MSNVQQNTPEWARKPPILVSNSSIPKSTPDEYQITLQRCDIFVYELKHPMISEYINLDTRAWNDKWCFVCTYLFIDTYISSHLVLTAAQWLTSSDACSGKQEDTGGVQGFWSTRPLRVGSSWEPPRATTCTHLNREFKRHMTRVQIIKGSYEKGYGKELCDFVCVLILYAKNSN